MTILKKLLGQGELSALSYFFAEFISQQSSTDMQNLLAYSAALVSENNLLGDVCIDMKQYLDQPLFSSEKFPLQDLPQVTDFDQWRQCLLESPCVGNPGETTPMVLEHHRLYLNRYWHYETQVAKSLLSRLTPLHDIDEQQLSQQLEQLFPDNQSNSQLNPQIPAVTLAATRPFVAICGGPGTGKTTTVIKILAILLAQHPTTRIQLAAPTGKAAARMMESVRLRMKDSYISAGIRELIPQQASTIHRLLGYRNHRFHYSSTNLLPLDCLVIDEASMLDLTLMYHLLDALPDTARIILLGDRDQLASVAAGNVLGDITGHGQAIRPSTSRAKQLPLLPDDLGATTLAPGGEPAISDSIALLTKSYRFGKDSGIEALANMINRGQSNKAVELLQAKDSRLKLLSPVKDTVIPAALDWATRLYQPVLESDNVSQAMDAFDRSRVLAAIHSGPFGVNEINRLISTRLQPEYIADSDEYRGKPILITANDYELDLFNGDTGLLWPDQSGQLRACFRTMENSIREIPIHSLPEYVTAWAMTVHKAQGSEFDSVLLILPSHQESRSLSRELLYTAVTRTRHDLLIHSPIGVLSYACERPTQRASGLADKLGWKNNGSSE
jgi:exodeoxyribonuclease V alpha subunit